MATTLVRIQHRRSTAATWTSTNEVLLAGEIGHESDTGKFKVGDGTTGWTALGYSTASTQGTVNVRDYGAKGDGTTDDSPAFTAALAALTAGGLLFVPAGRYRFASTVTIGKPVQIAGAIRTGANPVMGAQILDTTGAVTPFDVQSDHVTFRELGFSCSAAASAVAAGLAEGIRFTSGNYCAIERCRFAGWWIGVHVEAGYGWIWRDCYVVNQFKYGALIRNTTGVDAGDQLMEGFQFDADMTTHVPDAAIRYESGGGLKMVGNKITHHGIGLDLAVADGAATSVLTMTGNSLELQTVNCVRLGRAGTTGTYARIVIAGNQLSANAAAQGGISINDGISEVVITGNAMNGAGSITHYVANGGSAISIKDNQSYNGLIGIHVKAAAKDVSVRGNTATFIGTPVIDESSVSGTSPMNDIEMRNVRYVPFISIVTATYTNLWKVLVKDRDGGTITVRFPGRLESGIAGFATEYRRAVFRPAAGTGITVNTIGTDVTSPYVDVQFDTTINPGYVTIGLKVGAGASGVAGAGGISVRGFIDCVGGYDRIVPL